MARSFYPSLTSLLDPANRPSDGTLLSVRKSVRSILSELLWFFVACVALYFLDSIFPNARPPQSIPVLKHFSFRWLSIVPILLFLDVIRRYHNDLYVFEPEKITQFSGRLALKYEVPVIKYIHIRGITIKQDIIGRILNYGTLQLGTAGDAAMEVEIKGVRDPVGLANLIEDIRNHEQKKLARVEKAGASKEIAANS